VDQQLVEGLYRDAIADADRLYLPKRDAFLTGLPNFRRFFVRDSLWFAQQILAMPKDNPIRQKYLGSVRSILVLIAQHQASTPNPISWEDVLEWPPHLWHRVMRDAEFGQMPHEIPRNKWDWLWLKMHFGIGFMRGHPYYGSIDATPLWLITVAEYVRQTDDTNLVDELEVQIGRAYRWIAKKLNEGDGLVRYRKRRAWNLKHHSHQGWRDGSGSGALNALGLGYPIALLDVQCIIYRALTDITTLGPRLGTRSARIESVQNIAETLRERIINDYWSTTKEAFVFALHEDGVQVPSVSIEQVFLIWCGVLKHDARAIKVRNALLDENQLWTDYGPRTWSIADPFFDAQSYHRGSGWPWLSWLAYEAIKQSGNSGIASRLREAALRGFIEVHGHEELFMVSEHGEVGRIKKSASPQLWSVGAALALAADELTKKQ